MTRKVFDAKEWGGRPSVPIFRTLKSEMVRYTISPNSWYEGMGDGARHVKIFLACPSVRAQGGDRQKTWSIESRSAFASLWK